MSTFMLMYRIASLRRQHPILAIVWSVAYVAIFGSAAFGFTMFLVSGGRLGLGMAVVSGLSWSLGMAAATAVFPVVPRIQCWKKQIRLPSLTLIWLLMVGTTLPLTMSSLEALMLAYAVRSE